MADSFETAERSHRSLLSRVHLMPGALGTGSEEEISCTPSLESFIAREGVIDCLTMESSVIL